MLLRPPLPSKLFSTCFLDKLTIDKTEQILIEKLTNITESGGNLLIKNILILLQPFIIFSTHFTYKNMQPAPILMAGMVGMVILSLGNKL